mgnify:CR=1 FL=1
MTATDPADLGAIEARQMIARRQLSPLELAEACIARVEAVDHAVNALVARDFDRVIDAQISIANKLGQGARTKIFRVIPGFRNLGKAREFHKKIAEIRYKTSLPRAQKLGPRFRNLKIFRPIFFENFH